MGLEMSAGAWRLLGMELDSGWKIVEPIGWDPATGRNTDHYNGTGGNFSVPYIVEKDGRRAFLKAIDLSSALGAVNVLQKLHEITSAHNFEARLLEICGNDRMDRVVVALESGQISVGPNLQDAAPYLIFELADGDVRRRIQKVSADGRLAWWLRAMHHTAVGLSQLHSRGIAHQDLKPSNVLSFGQKDDFRVADLGRSVCHDTTGPHDELIFSGDWGYAPPEILYGHVIPDFYRRRIGCDLYMLGSMIFFYATGFGCTQQIFDRLENSQRPIALRGTWKGEYETALPMLQTCFTELLADLEQVLPVDFATDLIKAASELCNPDPNLRGHPLERMKVGNQFSLVRYVTLFDLLAKRAEISVNRSSLQ